MYEEAHPIFYAAQTFHYPLTTGGLSFIDMSSTMSPWNRERFVRQGAMPCFSKNLHLMVNLSVDFEVSSHDNADSVLCKQIEEFAQHCPQLRKLTIHLLLGMGLAYSATRNVLRQLHRRLDSLSIIILGSSPDEVVPRLRTRIADHRCWSYACIAHRLDDTRQLQWPYLTIPSMIQNYINRTSSGSVFKFRLPSAQE